MALLTPIQIFTTQQKQITVSCYQQQRALREVLLKHHAQISFQLLHCLLCHYKLEVSQVGISLLHIHNPPSMAELAAMHAHVLSKLHFAAPELPRPHHPLSLTWVFRMVQGMEIGNKFYDSHSAGDPVMFGVQEAVQKVQASLGITSVRSELPADITRQPVATANLPHHIQLASLVNQTTSVFIIDQKTVAFIPMGQHVLLLDSHCHAQSGAHIAMAPSSRIWELMEWYKAFICFPYSMGTVTNVSFK